MLTGIAQWRALYSSLFTHKVHLCGYGTRCNTITKLQTRTGPCISALARKQRDCWGRQTGCKSSWGAAQHMIASNPIYTTVCSRQQLGTSCRAESGCPSGPRAQKQLHRKNAGHTCAACNHLQSAAREAEHTWWVCKWQRAQCGAIRHYATAAGTEEAVANELGVGQLRSKVLLFVFTPRQAHTSCRRLLSAASIYPLH